jgi:dihydroorotate dehydrogenase/Pyruvate/2-oxoacid:ferredoxin oxidoreductase delta subunit
MADLSVEFAGLRLRNPLVASAGPVTANVEMARRLRDAGVGAVVTKTGFTTKEYERWVGRRGIFPYKPVYKYQSLHKGRLLSLPTLSDVPVEEMARRLERMKSLGVPIVGSIMGLTPKGYRESARILESAGADAIELDLCCTIPEFISRYRYAGQNVNFYPKLYAKLVKTVKDAVSVPVGAKSTVSLYVYPKLLEGLIRTKLANRLPDFVTLVGQLDENPGVNLDTLEPLIPHISTFGWQGSLAKLTYSALATFASALGTRHPVLSASGGIRDAEGVITSMALGATTVQFQTAILDRGARVLTKILKDLEDYLEAHNIPALSQIIGRASQVYIPSLLLGSFMLERDTLYGTLFARADPGLCNGCGLCAEICTEHAAEIRDEKAFIAKSACRACNLCVLKCPQGAIRLENYGRLEALIEKYKQAEAARSFRAFMGKERIGLADKLALPARLRIWGLA